MNSIVNGPKATFQPRNLKIPSTAYFTIYVLIFSARSASTRTVLPVASLSEIKLLDEPAIYTISQLVLSCSSLRKIEVCENLLFTNVNMVQIITHSQTGYFDTNFVKMGQKCQDNFAKVSVLFLRNYVIIKHSQMRNDEFQLGLV